MIHLINGKILLSGATILAAAALVVGGTFAFFSDTETSTGNTFAAGEIDLTIDNESFFNGVLSQGTTWLVATDLTDELFFNFSDVKPGDFGEDTISLHVENNDSWVCADVKLTGDDDVSLTEPETPDDPNGLTSGELADAVDFLWWADDGDNVLEDNETTLPSGPIGNLSVGSTATVDLADSDDNIWRETVFPGGESRFIAKAWCHGDISIAPLTQGAYTGPDNPTNDGVDPTGPATSNDGGFVCDGSNADNSTQTDTFTADISFRAIQSRNNLDFECEVPTP